jgi:hypothetical protein
MGSSPLICYELLAAATIMMSALKASLTDRAGVGGAQLHNHIALAHRKIQCAPDSLHARMRAPDAKKWSQNGQKWSKQWDQPHEA